MFQLLVSFSGWGPAYNTMNRTRVFEFTDQSLVARFKPGNDLDGGSLLDVPALFASEGTSSGTPLARVGRITRVGLVSGAYKIEYELDRDIPGIHNATLDALSGRLSIERWELGRTHWAVKDIDLFQVLLKHDAISNIRPKLFTLSEDPVEDESVAVMMPFAAEFTSIYQTLQKAANDVRMSCSRADDIWKNDVIIQDVVRLICNARVVICDLTGRNPNVFYEAGIAHTLGKDVILIAQHDSDIPFDLRHIRHIKYHANSEGLASLQEQVASRLETLLE